MDLFVMNRYNGHTNEEADKNDSKEERILARLNARKSKRSRQEFQQPDGSQPEDISEALPSVVEEPADETPAPIKKSKKRRKKDNGDLATDSNVTITEPLEAGNQPVSTGETEDIGESREVEETDPGFTILGEVEEKENEKVHRVLPDWLQKPSTISCSLREDRIPISAIPELDKHLVHRLEKKKIDHFFPVQQQVIPWLLKSLNSPYRQSDVCVSAPTGSGKTLAFVLPIVQALLHRTVCRVRALVILPVHDLAVQVYRVFNDYCLGTKLSVALISGHASYTQEQESLVRKGKCGNYLSRVDIVVCTPGRLVDHISRTEGFSLADLRFIVIDEADRIIEEAHNDWLLHVDKVTHRSGSTSHLAARTLTQPPTQRVQKLLFSATLSQDPEKLYRLGLFQPKLFTSVVKKKEAETENTTSLSHRFIGKYTTPAELTEKYTITSQSLKPVLVHHLVAERKHKPALCFTASRAATHRLCVLLSNMGGVTVAEFSGQFSKPKREKLLRDFSNGVIDLLVCTDAVARGMDLGTVDCVISYDPPRFVKNYIHRVGRTARAGRPGTAITLLVDEQVEEFQELLRSAEKDSVEELSVATEELEHYENSYRDAIDNLRTTLNSERLQKTVKSSVLRRQGRFFKRSTPKTMQKP